MIKAVIFDMDGVIIDSEPLWEKATKIYFEKIGKKLPIDDSFSHFIDINFRGRRQKEVVAILKKKFNIKGGFENIMKIRMKILLDVFDRELKLVPGILSLIKKLYEKKIPMVVASSSPKKVINYSIKKFGLRKYFKKIVSGDSVKKSKPAPDVFINAAKEFKTTKFSEILVIEDSYSGVSAARRAKMKCLAIHHNYTDQKYFKTAHMVVRTFNKISLKKIINI